MSEFQHQPVLLRETIDQLALLPGMTAVDCTAGGGGHSEAILQRILPGGHLLAIDQDIRALAAARARLSPLGEENFTLVHSNFTRLPQVLEENALAKPQGILMDLGVSSHQLDAGERGFSYRHEGPLDMRMNPEAQAETAADLVNHADLDRLADILWRYGEERWSRRIAEFIGMEREKAPIETTGQLTAVIKKAIPAGAREDGPHPARRTFQALRIAINGELDILPDALEAAIKALAPKGRLAVITFHSLEDRIVKNTFRLSAQGCICPKDLPICVCNRQSLGKVMTTKPILPSAIETEENPRARSAKLRVFCRR